MRALLCLIGLHDWHEHEVYSPGYYIKRSNPCLYWYDRICLRPDCKHEDRKASRLWQRDTNRRQCEIAAEERLREAQMPGE